MPKQLQDTVGFGDESEAIEYIAFAIRAWEQTPGALDWLRSNLAHQQVRRIPAYAQRLASWANSAFSGTGHTACHDIPAMRKIAEFILITQVSTL